MGNLIYWELCKKLKFDQTNKWSLHNPEAILENETHKFLQDFEIQTDHQISARQTDLVIVKKIKENLPNSGFAIPADHKVKIRGNEKRGKYINLARELKKTMKHEGVSDISCRRCTWDNPQRIDKGLGRLGNKRTSIHHPDYSIIKIVWKIQKDLRKQAFTQTQVKNHQLTMVRKTLNRVNNNNNNNDIMH